MKPESKTVYQELAELNVNLALLCLCLPITRLAAAILDRLVSKWRAPGA